MAELLRMLQQHEVPKSGLLEALQSSGEGLTSPAFSSQPANVNLNQSPRSTTTTGATNINLNIGPDSAHFFVDPNANGLADVDGALTKAKQAVATDNLRLLVAQVTDSATEAHINTSTNTNANLREVKATISQRQEGAAEHGVDPSKIPRSPEAMWQNFINAMLPSLKNVIAFSRRLAGFGQLAQEDQVTLIKQGIFEVMAVRASMLIDTHNDTMIDPGHKVSSPRSVVRQMSPFGPFIDLLWEVAKIRNPLNLTDGEQGLFTALLILCPDRKGLKNVSAVHTLQQLYLQVLHQLLRQNNSDADEKFCKLLSTIPTIRKINDEHFRLVNNIKQKSATEYEAHFPPLHQELFDTAA